MSALAKWALIVGIAVLGCGENRPARPDLFLISVEHLGTDALACFEGSGDAGQSLCGLARHGTRFAWTLSPGGGAASGAANLLTGVDQAVHRVRDDGSSFLADSQETLAEGLRGVGYATAAFIDSPTLNRSRRLDQGFDRYDDALEATDETAPERDLVARVQRWLAKTRPPRFVWIHLRADSGLADVDRLVARLDRVLAGEARSAGAATRRPGVLFVALRGRTVAQPGIALASHRVPLLWSPPSDDEASNTPAAGASALGAISFALTSLVDIAPTLLASAGVEPPETSTTSAARQRQGRVLGSSLDPDGPRFLLLDDVVADGEVGLVSGPHLYVRRSSPSDVTGRPISTEALAEHAARFLTLSEAQLAQTASARLGPLPWRKDVLSAQSPVPPLEFHLVQRLRERIEGVSN